MHPRIQGRAFDMQPLAHAADGGVFYFAVGRIVNDRAPFIPLGVVERGHIVIPLTLQNEAVEDDVLDARADDVKKGEFVVVVGRLRVPPARTDAAEGQIFCCAANLDNGRNGLVAQEKRLFARIRLVDDVVVCAGSARCGRLKILAIRSAAQIDFGGGRRHCVSLVQRFVGSQCAAIIGVNSALWIDILHGRIGHATPPICTGGRTPAPGMYQLRSWNRSSCLAAEKSDWLSQDRS